MIPDIVVIGVIQQKGSLRELEDRLGYPYEFHSQYHEPTLPLHLFPLVTQISFRVLVEEQAQVAPLPTSLHVKLSTAEAANTCGSSTCPRKPNEPQYHIPKSRWQWLWILCPFPIVFRSLREMLFRRPVALRL